MEVLKKWSDYHKWRRKRRSKYLFDRDGRCCAGSEVCAQTGVFIPWQGYILCGAAGAATNIIWPH